MSIPCEGTKHTVFVGSPLGQYQGTEGNFELECEACGYVGAADSLEEAEAIAGLHEEFIAVLVDGWEVPS